jgi:beta-lactamase regulating signal transducer with metallopeptidase domain/predicted  nucleic acid-binding Zn-ribbon protein
MSPAIAHTSSSFLTLLGQAAARSILLACLVAGALAALRVSAVSLKLRAWQGVLLVALAMPLLVAVSPGVPVPVPSFRRQALPQQESAAQTARVALRTVPAPDARTNTSAQLTAAPRASELLSTSPPSRAAWPVLLVGIYLGITLLLLGRLWVGVRSGIRLLRSAKPIEDRTASQALSACSLDAGLRRFPAIAESDMVAVPVTFGIRDSVILLPAAWREWEPHELAAVLAHEVSHVARRDALVQRLSLIHRAIFWFSPLAWWLDRHLAELAEQASDDAALSGGVDRVSYAETLLRFFGALDAVPERVWWQGVSMAKAGQAEKRVDRILAWRGAMRNQLKKPLIVAFAVFGMAAAGFTASVHPWLFDFHQTPRPPAAPVQPKPVARPSPAPETPALAPQPAISPDAAPAPVAESPLLDQVARMRLDVLAAEQSAAEASKQLARAKSEISNPTTEEQLRSIREASELYRKASARYDAALEEYRSALWAQADSGTSSDIAQETTSSVRTERPAWNGDTEYSVSDTDWDYSGPRFVIVTKGSRAVTMSGSGEDAAHAEALRSKIPSDFIWFERDEKSYIIRDQATVEKAKSFWAPQDELRKKQAELGEQQEALGKQQEELGRKMEEVRVKLPDLSADLEKLAAEMKRLSADGGTVEEIGSLQSEMGDLQSRIGEIESQAGRQQGAIGRQQGELGRQQGELGRQQGELGRQQGELARQASKQTKQLLDDAIAHGLAQPE